MKDFLFSEDIDIMCVTEVCLKEEELTSIKIENYRLVSYFCRIDHKAGGCAIWIKSSLMNYVTKCSIGKNQSIEMQQEIAACYYTLINAN